MVPKTTEKRNLLEAATLIGESASENGTWKVRLISEGKGSSGIYPAETLEKYHQAFDEVLSFENHPVGWDGPETRNFKQIVGAVEGATWIDTDERGKTGIYANWKPDSEYRDKIAEYKSKLGLSIYIEGDGYFDDDGEFVVSTLNENDPYRSVDIVLAAGRGGRFEESMRKMYDSRRSESVKPEVTSASEKERITMDEEMKEAFKALTDLIAPLVAKEQAAKSAEAQAEADEKAVEAAVSSYDAAVKAIDEADLLAPQVEALRAEARKGNDVAPLIEQAKAIKAAAVEAAKAVDESGEPVGRTLGESASTSYSIGAWN